GSDSISSDEESSVSSSPEEVSEETGFSGSRDFNIFWSDTVLGRGTLTVVTNSALPWKDDAFSNSFPLLFFLTLTFRFAHHKKRHQVELVLSLHFTFLPIAELELATIELNSGPRLVTMGSTCCCLKDECEDFANPNSSVYRNCICLRCFIQHFLHMIELNSGPRLVKMGSTCCCLRDECEDFANPNSSVYRNCICLRCFIQHFLHMVYTDCCDEID
ncbi:RING/U-box superfamily protein, partial [Striga asiatica]